ncbi:hypothetical protein BDZ85DRAFT_84943 [Elsinoe ampelina]|uniref:DUF7165 domain-containing protein n=1 Tax=Elsinoe ampelina TaxID=302913 RepID=A0A6A6GGI3_9PEZI|nr:hypothetical protein BDZ85DRAFT_84943 [Elsinoe ampelina]
MSFDQYEHRYSLRSDIEEFYSRDDFSELGPDDSASQIGRAVTTEELRATPRFRENPRESIAQQWVNNTGRSYSRLDYPTTPSSRRTSLRSSRLLSPTTFVPSRQDRVRYSWQSIHGDEPNRPRIHVIKIVSNTATASAGLPGGEAFGFSISPGGRRIAIYNSARLFILQTAALPVNISQEYSLKRRPLAIEIVDEGGILAVLSDEHTINVYDLSHHRVRRLKTFKPDFPTNAIALSPTGGVLAAAYEGGVEVFSLDPEALSTDRRAARSAKMDKLQFSDDGSTLIGTTTRINAAATVAISVPVFPSSEDNIPTHEELKEAWCTNMLEPINIMDSSHATFLRREGNMLNERLFSWNASEDTFGILNTQDVQYSNVDFPVTISPPLSTCGGLGAAVHSVPAIDERGDTVGMIVNDRTIRLYVVPHVDDDETKFEAHSIDHELDEEFGCPFSDIRWVRSPANLPAPTKDPSQVSGRLVVVSPGGVVDPSMVEESVADIEGGRIILFDFDPQYAGQPGQTFTLTLGKAPPQNLDEQEIDVAQEVDLVRRRTVNANHKIIQRTPTLGRAASIVNRSGSNRQTSGLQRNQSMNDAGSQSPVERLSPAAAARARPNPSSELSYQQSEALPNVDEEVTEALEEPYDGNNPRSVASLLRSASAVDSHRIQRFQERAAESVSARQNGFMPLPQYTEEPNAPLPSRYRSLAGLDHPKMMEKSTSSPQLTNGRTTSSSRDVLASQPSLDAIVAGPSARQQDADRAQVRTPQQLQGQFVPRGLARAYSNAVSPISVNTNNLRTPPQRNYEFDPISPMQRSGGTNSNSPHGSFRGNGSNISQPSAVSPVIGPSTQNGDRAGLGIQQQHHRERQEQERKEWEQRAERQEREQRDKERREYRERTQRERREQQEREQREAREQLEQLEQLEKQESAEREAKERKREAKEASKKEKQSERLENMASLIGTVESSKPPKRNRSTREEIEQRGRTVPRPSTSSQSLRVSNSSYAPSPVAKEPPPVELSALRSPRELAFTPAPQEMPVVRSPTNPNFVPPPQELPSVRSPTASTYIGNIKELPALPNSPTSAILPDLSRSPSAPGNPFARANFAAPPPHDPLNDPPPPLVRSASTSTPFRRNLPPHVLAMQDAFHSSNPQHVSSSLFPLNPHYRRHSAQPAGSVAHPIVGWRPPAPGGEMGSYGDEGYDGRSSVGSRPSSAPGGWGDGGGRRKKRWGSRRGSSSGRRTPRGKMYDDGTWSQTGEKKCVVM